MQEKTPPFRSASFYVTLVLTILLPVGLWLVGSSAKEVFQDFEIALSQLTLLFLNPWLPLLLLGLPLGVIAKEFLFHDRRVRHQCDVVFAVLAIIVIVVAGFALAVPFCELLNGLDG